MIKRITVNKYQKALVFNRNDEFENVLSEGSYWMSVSKTAFVCDISKEVVAPDINILLQSEAFANQVDVVDVADNEIVLMYANGLFTRVLTTGKYVFWKSYMDYKFIKADLTNVFIADNIDKNILTNKLFLAYTRTFEVAFNEKAVLYIDGKFEKVLSNGTYIFWKNNTLVSVYKADMRLQQMEISGQEILTKDKANIRMNAFVSYQVSDIVKAIADNKDFDKQLYVSVQLALRAFVGSLYFDDLMERKEDIQNYVLNDVKNRADGLGITVSGFGVRDIILPGDVKDIMNQVLIAEKKAQANTIMRREETASTRSLLNTAKLMEDNPMLYKLKEMEFVEKIAENISSISVNGNTALLDQLKTILVSK